MVLLLVRWSSILPFWKETRYFGIFPAMIQGKNFQIEIHWRIHLESRFGPLAEDEEDRLVN